MDETTVFNEGYDFFGDNEEETSSELTAYEKAAGINIADPYAVSMQDFSKLQREKLDEFDRLAWNAGNGYEAPSFPIWSEKLEGLAPGFYIFAGFSNAGKTAFAVNLAYDYAMHEENHLHMIYFTLDDTAQMAIPRIISMMKEIPISVSARPQRFQNKINDLEPECHKFNEWLKARSEGLQELKDKSGRIVIQDSSDMECAEKMLNYALMYKTYLQIEDPSANLIVVIDSLMDVNIDQSRAREEKDRNTQISRMMKDWADNKLKCPIFGTAHLRKNTGMKRPVISDLKESGRYEYDATAVFLVVNDVSRQGQNADIYYNKANDTEKHPVIEIHWAKNKASSFKERTYYYFEPNYSKVVECSKEQTEQYDSIIYSS